MTQRDDTDARGDNTTLLMPLLGTNSPFEFPGEVKKGKRVVGVVSRGSCGRRGGGTAPLSVSHKSNTPK